MTSAHVLFPGSRFARNPARFKPGTQPACVPGRTNVEYDPTDVRSNDDNSVPGRSEMVQTLAYLENLWGEMRRARAEGKTLEQARTSLTLKDRLPEVAGWRDERNRGKNYETLGIHQYNVEFLRKTLGK